MADKNESGIFKVAMNLILTCLVSGCIIGVVYAATSKIAYEKAEQMKQIPPSPRSELKNSIPSLAKKIPSSLNRAARKWLISFRRLRKVTAALSRC